MTFIKYSVLAMMVAAVIMAAGCGTKDPLAPTTTAKSDIMPLKVGNSWTYDLKAYYAPNQPPSEYYVYLITVTDTVTINSEKWYRTTISIPSAPVTYMVYFINRSDGLYFRASTTPSDSVYLRFKYPAQVGDTCHAAHEFFRVFWGMPPSFPAEIMSTNVSVQVPYDTLGCYNQYTNLVTSVTNPDYLDDSFRPNLGMMQSRYMIYNDVYGYYPYITWELTDVSLQ